MTDEDSGVIDLFAINARARASDPPPATAQRDIFSTPVPAFTTDLCGAPRPLEPDDADRAIDTDLDELDLDNPFGRKPRMKLALVVGGVVALLVIVGISVGTASGSSPAVASASAAGGREPATVITSPVATNRAEPVPEPPPPATPVPSPPKTGAVATSAPPLGGFRPFAQVRPRAPSGPKLTKVQSAGVVMK